MSRRKFFKNQLLNFSCNGTFLVFLLSACGSPTSLPDSSSISNEKLVKVAGLARGRTSLTSNSFAFTAGGADTGASAPTYECAIDFGSFDPCNSPLSVTGLAEGNHAFSVRATFSNLSVGPTTITTWTVDLTKPSVTISGQPLFETNEQLNQVYFNVSDPDANDSFQTECRIGNGSWHACSSPWTQVSSEGNHKLGIRAVDIAGNVSDLDEASWKVDLTEPAISLISAPVNFIPDAVSAAQFSLLDPNSTTAPSAECSLDGAPFTACTSPWAIANSTDGNHSARIRAKDGAGNVSQPNAFSWTVIRTLPSIRFDSRPEIVTGSTLQSLSFHAESTVHDGISGIECSLDGTAIAVCMSPLNLTGLSAGSHALSVRALDKAGNVSPIEVVSWTIDLVPPSVSISLAPPAVTSRPNAALSFAGTDAGGSTVSGYECSIDGDDPTPCVSPRNVTGLTDGAHEFSVWAKDAVGNRSVPASYFWTIDRTAPVISITSMPDANTPSSSAAFQFAATDSGGGTVASYRCSLDNSTPASCSSPHSLSALTAGAHLFSVRAEDSAGNVSLPSSYSWTVDTSQVTPTIISAPASLTSATTATISFNHPAGFIGTSFECSIDAGTYATCTTPRSITGLTSGSHIFKVRSIDSGGTLTSDASHSWTIDRTAPTVTITSAPPATTNSTSAAIAFSATDSGGGTVASYQCALDGASFASCTSPQNYASLVAGSHTFQVRATDSVGNISSVASATWGIDLSAPTITITSAPSSITNATSASIAFNATDSGGGSVASYQCSLNAAPFNTCSIPQTYSSLTAGNYSFQVRAVDSVGNVSTAASASWTIDRTAPTVTITSAPPATTNSTSAAIAFSATDSGGGTVASYQCALDGASFASCTSPQNYASLVAGSHTFQVRATDSVGNISSVASATWGIDLSAPTITITSAPSSITNATSASIAFNATDSGGGSVASYQCSLNAAPFNTCSIPQTYSSLTAGNYSFQVRAVDSVGNVSTAASASWTIDRTAPTVTITSAPPATTNSTSAAIAFSATDSGGGTVASYQCALDGASFASCTSPQNYASLVAGSHTFQVRATDSVGNVSSVASATWTIQGSNPSPSYDYLVSSAAELNSVMALPDAALSGKTIAYAPGAYPKLTVVNRKFTSYVKFTSQDNLNRARLEAILIANSNNVDIDGLNVVHSSWPANPGTGFGRELIYFSGKGTNLRIQNCEIRHGYGNTTWSGWPAGTTGLIPFDAAVTDYPEYGYSYNNIYGPNDGQYYGTFSNPVPKGGLISDSPTTIDVLNDLDWAVPPTVAGGGVRIVNEGINPLTYTFSDGTTGVLIGKSAEGTTSRPKAHLYFAYSPSRGTLTLSSPAGQTTRAIVRTDVSIANWMAYGIGGQSGYENLEILNNKLSSLSNGIKFSFTSSGTATSKIKVIGNQIDTIYADVIAFGVGLTPPTETTVAWNTGSRVFNKPGIFAGGDPGDPHGDFIQFFGDDGGTQPGVDVTGSDWRNIKVFGNVFYKGNGRGYVQGMFLSDMPNAYGISFRNMYVAGNLLLSANMGAALATEGYDNYIFGNTALRSEPTEADNFSDGAGAATLSVGAYNAPGKPFTYVGSNIAESFTFDTSSLDDNNVTVGRGGDYSAYLKGPFVNSHSSMSDVFTAFSPKTGSVTDLNKVGALGHNYVDYANRTIDKTKERPMWRFETIQSAAPNTVQLSNISGYMGGLDNQTLSVPSDVATRVCDDPLCTTILRDWASGNTLISPSQYVQMRATSPTNPAETRSVVTSVNGTTRNWNITSASPPFPRVDFLGDFLKTIGNSGLISQGSLLPTKFVLAFRLGLGAFSANDVIIQSQNRFNVMVSTGGALKISVGTSADRSATFSNAIPIDGTVNDFFLTIDTTAASADDGIKLYRNSSPVTIAATGKSWNIPTLSNQNFGSGSAKVWSVMAGNGATFASSPIPTALEGGLDYLYFAIGASATDSATGQLLDISKPEVRNRFTTTFIRNDGSGPTGYVPELFLSGNAAAWNSGGGINRGSGNKLFMNSIDTGVVDR